MSDELDELLDDFDRRAAAYEAVPEEVLEARVSAVTPVLEDIAERLIARGHHAKFSVEGRSAALDVQPARLPGKPRHLVFTVSRTGVTVRQRTSGERTPTFREEFALHEFTPDVVKAKILAWLREVMEAALR